MLRIKYLFHISWYHLLFNHSFIIKKRDSKLSLSKGVRIRRSKIILEEGASLFIGKETHLEKSSIVVSRGSIIKIGDANIISSKSIRVNGELSVGDRNYLVDRSGHIWLQKGSLHIGNCNRIKANVWIRFDGIVIIGNYNTINDRTQLRCDERIEIGSYNQISMDIRIWDTNTHRIFSTEDSYKEHIISHYPNWNEDEKPKTKPVKIGDCNWLGEDVIVKSSKIGNHCILGTRTMLINREIGDDLSVTNIIEYRIVEYSE